MAMSMEEIAAEAVDQIQEIETASHFVAIAVKVDTTRDNLVFVGRNHLSGVVAVSVFTRGDLWDCTDIPAAFQKMIKNLLSVLEIARRRPRQSKPVVASASISAGSHR